MLKSILSRGALVALAVATAMSFTAPAAEAKTKVHIWIGLGGFPYWYGPGVYHGRYRDRLTCNEGRHIVDHRGFNAVNAIDCVPRVYHYKAKRSGKWYTVALDARNGSINWWRR